MEDQNTTMPQTPEQVEVVDIQFRPGQKIYFFDPAGFSLQSGDHVIIDTARGPEYGTCVSGNHTVSGKDIVVPLRPVLRPATRQDEETAAKNQETEQKAYRVCLEKIAEQELDMQLVSAECAFDGSRILFFFTADERVDFRDLVKSLASTFHTRIELRQIGVRDKAKMVGGLGICGRPFCCASFLDDFQPVSIKMAKTQNLSLNPTKISGTCGRLMCCLKYEQDAYEDLLRTSPKPESFVDTPDGRGSVVEVDLLRQRVKVKLEDRPEVITTFANSDIAVFRNGKAKKTDAPIPADWAPISGRSKREKKEENLENKEVFLDSIRLRYSEETIAEEVVPESVPAEHEKAPRQNRRPKPKGNKPAQQKKAEAPQKEAAQQAPAPEEKKPAGRRPNYRRRRRFNKPNGEKKES